VSTGKYSPLTKKGFFFSLVSCLLADTLTWVSKWVPEMILHQTLIEVPPPLKGRLHPYGGMRPRNYRVPSCRPSQKPGYGPQLGAGSGKGQNLTNNASTASFWRSETDRQSTVGAAG
jgi:hypothetical protein